MNILHKNTAENIRVYAKTMGYLPVQIDGIPEGFSFKTPDITIGGKNHTGPYCAFIPNYSGQVVSDDVGRLLKLYKIGLDKKENENGKRN